MSTETSKRKERIAKDTLGTNIIARHTCFLTFKSPEMHASPGSFRKSEVAKTSVTINSILVNIPHPLYSLNKQVQCEFECGESRQNLFLTMPLIPSSNMRALSSSQCQGHFN